jgi:hypothetical protein
MSDPEDDGGEKREHQRRAEMIKSYGHYISTRKPVLANDQRRKTNDCLTASSLSQCDKHQQSQ